ncbi:MAG: WecB/TagA/CpsF family glycosyltransferase [Clostridia bacterium]|nr:WecB/TagA/CpsF family glycosyltransferase [Clostridia bacterium]
MESVCRNTVDILGVQVDRRDFAEALQTAIAYLSTDTAHAIYTPNPEIIMKAYRDKTYCDVLNRASMVVPDGIGVVYGARILKRPVAERVAGYDLSCALLTEAGKMGKKVFLFGGKPGVAELAAENMENRFPGLKICGTAHGYHKDTSHIASAVQKAGADIVLVCLGAPKQEIWIDANKDQTGAKILIGAGGSLDVFAGTVKRAPALFCKLNLEWFYRLIKQPTRIGRMMDLPRFAVTVLLHGKRQKG